MWEQIKQVIDIIGGKFVIAEGGNPRYIVMAFEEFRKLLGAEEKHDPHAIGTQTLKETPKIVTAKTLERPEEDMENINRKMSELSREEEEAKRIRIEDLPF